MPVTLETQAAQIAVAQVAAGAFVSGANIARSLGLSPTDGAAFHLVALAATRAAM